MKKEKVALILHLAVAINCVIEVLCDVSEINALKDSSIEETTYSNLDSGSSLVSGFIDELPEDPHVVGPIKIDLYPHLNEIDTTYSDASGYVYNKPDIPFETETVPGIEERVLEDVEEKEIENFNGYDYPKPSNPMTYPPSTTDQTFPEASARILDGLDHTESA